MWFVLLGGTVAWCGCGYRSLHAQQAASEQFAVVGAPPLAGDAALVAEVEAGVRYGLAEMGALRAGRDYPRVVVELLRLDVASEGIARLGPDLPLARGTRVGVVARAWVERSEAAPRERDTGDTRTWDVMAAESDARQEALRFGDATRASARRLGGHLARRVLGLPSPDDVGF